MINPIQRIKEEKNLTLMEMATIFNVSESTLYQNLKGGRRELSEQILSTLDEMGYNIDEIKEEYRQFKLKKRLELMESN